MFYKFKITKTGLKFLGKTSTEKDKKGILYLTEQDIERLSPEAVSNIKDLKEV